jgi:hypothetical protein
MKPVAKAKLLTIDAIDGRTAAAKAVRDTMAAIDSDLGGDLTAAQRAIVQRAAVTSAVLEDMASQWLATGQLDAAMWATLSNLERRLYETLGIERRSKDVTPSIDEIAQEIEAAKNDN